MPHMKFESISTTLRENILSGKYADGEKLPTEKELSATYQVSRQTIRKALNGLVSEGILKSIQGSGYYVTIKQLPIRRTMAIAVITSYISEYIFPSLLRSIQTALAEEGYTVSLYATNNSIVTEQSILTQIIEKNTVDGIIVEGTKTALPNPNVKYYEQIADSNIPIIFINNYYPNLHRPNIKEVKNDNFLGSKYLVDYLTQHGHRRIGAFFKNDDIQGIQRYEGYIHEMLEQGADFNESNIGWYSTENKGDVAQTIKNGNYFRNITSNCTALICYNDEITKSVVEVLDEFEDCSITVVCSFDSKIPITSKKGIHIRSIGYPEETGDIAARKLLYLISGIPEDSETLRWRPLKDDATDNEINALPE